MKISVFGLGYVGSVSAACLADQGHQVIGVDVQTDKVEAINAGSSLVSEPGLAELVKKMVTSGRLAATSDGRHAVEHSDVSLICVGTPSQENGSLSLTAVKAVAREIGACLANHPGYHVVCVRSTVLPGTSRDVIVPILEEASGRIAGEDFGICMNPEFLREGVAISDYYEPSQIVMGALDQRSSDVAMKMYEGIEAKRESVPLEVAESVKYVCNTFHALKVAYANEIGNLCKEHGIDGREVMKIFCNDRKLNISDKYLSPGFAFGGSCLPKDCRALLYRAKERDVSMPVMQSILRSNQLQIERGIRLVERTGKQRVGVLGLSFKSGTDDVRESPVVPLVETLVGRGYQVKIFDPCVEPAELFGTNETFLKATLPHVAKLMQPSLENLVKQVDVIVVTNGSPEFAKVLELADSSQTVIDLHGIDDGCSPQDGSYDGICW